ncbi:dUTP diphosphatase [Bacillus sp. FJAT-27251]|uniref:dUTP diphosphatase n=1 Tax=Bacillus sp. FJAT-27251 TaxID=1684142 RepID=UPI0006A7AB40|nr:dUTP diphosphatase [Bacillus sp. FJAT-27251]
MNIEKLYEMQEALDRHIEEQHGLQSEKLIDRKVLALLVELGELANETRCFKFWSLKPASGHKVILEEFVDGIHFILSLGIETGFRESEFADVSLPSCTLSEQFLVVYSAIDEFRRNLNQQAYSRLFREYMAVARMLGFTGDDVVKAYIEKNEVNYERQRSGY